MHFFISLFFSFLSICYVHGNVFAMEQPWGHAPKKGDGEEILLFQVSGNKKETRTKELKTDAKEVQNPFDLFSGDYTEIAVLARLKDMVKTFHINHVLFLIDHEHNTLLHRSVSLGYRAVVDYLLHQSDICWAALLEDKTVEKKSIPERYLDQKNQQGLTVLHIAVMAYDFEMTQNILAYNPIIKGDTQGKTPVDYACNYALSEENKEEFPLLDILLKYAEDRKQEIYVGWLLAQAVRAQKASLLKCLLKYSFTQNNIRNNVAVMFNAMLIHDDQLVDLLLALRPVGAVNHLFHGEALSHLIAQRESQTDNLQKLMELSYIDLNVRNNKGQTPFRVAIAEGKAALVQLFLNAGFLVNGEKDDNPQQNPLWEGIGNAQRDVVLLFLRHPEIVIDMGSPVIAKTFAVMKNAGLEDNISLLSIVRLLVLYGASLNGIAHQGLIDEALARAFEKKLWPLPLNTVPTVEHATTLWLAAIEGNYEMVSELLNNKAYCDVLNIADEDGATLIMYVAGQGNVAIVKLLIEKGASLLVTTNDNHSILNILDAILERGFFDPNKPKDHYEEIKDIVKKSIDILGGNLLQAVPGDNNNNVVVSQPPIASMSPEILFMILSFALGTDNLRKYF